MIGFFFFKELCISEVCDNGPVGMLVCFTKQTLSSKDYMEILPNEIACLAFASK